MGHQQGVYVPCKEAVAHLFFLPNATRLRRRASKPLKSDYCKLVSWPGSVAGPENNFHTCAGVQDMLPQTQSIAAKHLAAVVSMCRTHLFRSHPNIVQEQSAKPGESVEYSQL